LSDLSTFGGRLKAARNARSLDQKELAQLVGSSKGYISELETNPDIRPSAELVMKLAESLETTVEYLMRGNDPSTNVFFRNYQELDDPTKQKLLGILKVLKDS
jgi:transcriptional regulator with XRE-family HTH domain